MQNLGIKLFIFVIVRHAYVMDKITNHFFFLIKTTHLVFRHTDK